MQRHTESSIETSFCIIRYNIFIWRLIVRLYFFSSSVCILFILQTFSFIATFSMSFHIELVICCVGTIIAFQIFFFMHIFHMLVEILKFFELCITNITLYSMSCSGVLIKFFFTL